MAAMPIFGHASREFFGECGTALSRMGGPDSGFQKARICAWTILPD
jgi:hypothetical protein